MRYRFQITLHARPGGALATEPITLAGGEHTRVIVPPELIATTFGVSFEQVSARLEALPRMFIEPDGSFVWVSPHEEAPSWQLDGVLYDRDGRLLYVDLKGECPPPVFDTLLGCLGWPKQAVLVQLVREAVFLDETTFRGFAAVA